MKHKFVQLRLKCVCHAVVSCHYLLILICRHSWRSVLFYVRRKAVFLKKTIIVLLLILLFLFLLLLFVGVVVSVVHVDSGWKVFFSEEDNNCPCVAVVVFVYVGVVVIVVLVDSRSKAVFLMKTIKVLRLLFLLLLLCSIWDKRWLFCSRQLLPMYCFCCCCGFTMKTVFSEEDNNCPCVDVVAAVVVDWG